MTGRSAAQHGAAHPHDEHDALDPGDPEERGRDATPPDKPDDPEGATDSRAGTEDDPAAG
ncbi:hypothetical protein [Pseudonocardia xishanensis]|uniref:Uncharacterized protein n=1 Tax=Pseudonocardia xishanensis TaxID=630995 RepID=A0ABP8S0U9_9PSEU